MTAPAVRTMDANGDGARLDRLFRESYGVLVGVGMRVLRDLDESEDVVQEVFLRAAHRWPAEGRPANPEAWLARSVRNLAIDRWRRARRSPIRSGGPDPTAEAAGAGQGSREEDLLHLLFVCCHPRLLREGRVALALRVLGGLTTEEIAAAYLVPAATIAQRIVRAKRRIRDEKLAFEIPEIAEIAEGAGGAARLDSVMEVIYLVFNEGYAASAGDAIVRAQLAGLAIRLATFLARALPGDAEALGLLALLELQQSRAGTRVDGAGGLLLLSEQPRDRWDRAAIERGTALLERAMARRDPGPYQVQAAIAACHAEAPRWEETDWAQIVALYDRLHEMWPTPVVALARAVAVAERDGPAAGLAALARVDAAALRLSHRLPAVRGELLRRLGRLDEAAAALADARSLCHNEPERAWLDRRRDECLVRRNGKDGDA